MAVKLVHAKARTRDRAPAGYVIAKCGAVVRRRMARKSGVSCPLCLVVMATTAATTAAVTATRSNNSKGGGRR